MKHCMAVRAHRSQVTNRVDGVTALLAPEWRQVMHMDEALPLKPNTFSNEKPQTTHEAP